MYVKVVILILSSQLKLIWKDLIVLQVCNLLRCLDINNPSSCHLQGWLASD